MAGCVAAAASSASATFSDPFLRVQASNASGSGTFLVPLGDVTINPNGSAIWMLAAHVNIMSGPNIIATITQMNSFVRPQSGNLPNLISVGFTFTAGSSTTTFIVDSTIFGISPIINEAARTSAGFTLTDQNGDTATLAGANATGNAFRAAYNGVSPGGTQFASILTGGTTTQGGSTTMNASVPGMGAYTPIGDVNDMSSRWHFTLTARDQVGATSAWEVIPGPGAAALFALGGLSLARRRNRN